MGATTNRIAEAAGVSVGSLYEYFPNKEALLLALAERHVELARRGVSAALRDHAAAGELVPALQRAILASHQYPSEALGLVASPAGLELREQADQLHEHVLVALEACATAHGLDVPSLRARAAFDAIGPLTVRAMLEAPDDHTGAAGCYLEMALAVLGAPAPLSRGSRTPW